MSNRADLNEEYAAFDVFWESYPRKIAKIAASRQFSRAIRKTTLQNMLAALEWQKKTSQWQREIIPNASTWLHQERWKDEPPRKIAPPTPTPAELEQVARIRERKRQEFLLDTEEYYRTHPLARR